MSIFLFFSPVMFCNWDYCTCVHLFFQLRDFIKSWYIGQNTSIVGVGMYHHMYHMRSFIALSSLGVNHEELVRLATKGFAALPDLLPRSIPKAEYVGGKLH